MEGVGVEDSIELIGDVVFLTDNQVVSLLVDGVGNPFLKFTVEVGDVSNEFAAGVLIIVVVGDDNEDDDDNDDNDDADDDGDDDDDDDGNNDDDVDNDDNGINDNQDDDGGEDDAVEVARLCCSVVILLSNSEFLVHVVVRDGNSWFGVT